VEGESCRPLARCPDSSVLTQRARSGSAPHVGWTSLEKETPETRGDPGERGGGIVAKHLSLNQEEIEILVGRWKLVLA